MKLCEKCKVVRPQDEFSLHTRQNIANICRLCNDLTSTSMDNTIYRSILRAIRRDERKRGALVSYAFIIQETDVKHIVENIWHGHSVLSQCSVKYDLRLPRWNIALDWSPWNCALLTEAEAKAHVKMKKLEAVYDANVIADIKSKHALAVSAFKQLKEVDHGFVESGDWWKVGLDGKTV
jgi:IQ and ubiquitin-like domain-containing protein